MKFTIRLFLLCGLLVSFASGTLPSYEKLRYAPTSIEKDYYIWRYLQNPSVTPMQAHQLIKQASRLNKKLIDAYQAKTGMPPPALKTQEPPTADHIWKKRLRAKKAFKQALALLKKGRTQSAIAQLDIALKNYIRKEEKDKVLFWLYLVTKKTIYLHRLRGSYDPNLYTLLASDAFMGKYPKTLTFTFKRKKTPGFNPSDPLAWAKLKKQMRTHPDLKLLAKRYASKECIGVCTYIRSKSDPKLHNAYFPMPYRRLIKHKSLQRQALIYAIARQESRFIPAAVSRSFALGMMQIMPFLIRHIAEEKNERIDLDDIFKPAKAIEYANHHLDYLEKYLKHPLFVAYAYNGGIGFTKRLLQSGRYFRKGAYEPYMSLETIPNEQAREYGKKVLANYVIYLNKLGKSTRITPLIEALVDPAKTDRFRQ